MNNYIGNMSVYILCNFNVIKLIHEYYNWQNTLLALFNTRVELDLSETAPCKVLSQKCCLDHNRHGILQCSLSCYGENHDFSFLRTRG